MKKNMIRSSWMGYCSFSVLSHNTVDCIVTQARRGSLGQAGHGHDTALRHGEERPQHGQGRLRYGRPAHKGKRRTHEGRATEGLCRDTNGRIVTGTRLGRWVVSRYRRDTPGESTATRRRECAAIQPPRPTTRRSVHAGWARCAPSAPNQFWTQCTVSESLFGTLFMNTVHEHCSQNFSK